MAGTALNLVLISAILSAMLSAVFGLGRMIRSLVIEGHAPQGLKDNTDVPYRGILFSGLAMLAISMVVFFSLTYFAVSRRGGLQGSDERVRGTLQSNFATEFSEELYGDKDSNKE